MVLVFFLLLLFPSCNSFLVCRTKPHIIQNKHIGPSTLAPTTVHNRKNNRPFAVAAAAAASTDSTSNGQVSSEPVASSMRVKDIQAELKERNVAYDDCFDKESLVQRLVDAREGIVAAKEKEDENEPSNATTGPSSRRSATTTGSDAKSETTAATTKRPNFDRVEKLQELRSTKVKELREECGKRRIRWSRFVEKEDYVQALLAAMESSARFSVSGVMLPGQVTDLTGDQLEEELSQPSDAPLLLDIYATWCGPCKMMAPQLELAASDLGEKMRVGKIDSDKYPAIAQRLKASGLPTVLILNGDNELERIEGAMMKDQILSFVAPFV
jgi:thioredoxin